MDIISAYGQAGTYRGAAAMCGTTPKTVRRVIERAEAGGVAPVRERRPRNYECVTELVTARVVASQGRISAKRLLPVAVAAGFEGSARNFRRLVASVKQDYRRDHHRGRRPAVWAPGEFLVMDWTDLGGGLHLFCAVLAWSRWRFVRFAADEQAGTTMAMVADALAAAGGVPAKVLTDRMGCLKGGVVAGVMIPTPAYVRFAGHYGFTPDWCHASDPESKGIVENLCGYAQRDMGVPLLTEARLAGRVVGVDEGNRAAQVWCAEVNAAVHSQICAVPDQRLAQEVVLFGPLPSLRVDTGPEPVTRKVDRLSCVRFASARYSVPTRLIGSAVIVRAGQGRLRVVEPGTGRVVADHALTAPGQASVCDEHYGGPRPAPGRGPRPRTVTEQVFCGLGPAAEAFLVGAAAAGNTRLAGDLGILLDLRAAHGDEALLAALHRAVAFKRWHAADVRSILATGTAAPTPRGPGQALVLDLPGVTARSLADYAVTSDQDGDSTDSVARAGRDVTGAHPATPSAWPATGTGHAS